MDKDEFAAAFEAGEPLIAQSDGSSQAVLGCQGLCRASRVDRAFAVTLGVLGPGGF